MALGSIERHLFVFHGQFLTRYHLLVSKLPMIFSIIYPFAFYTSVVFGSWWCTNVYDYSTLACGAPCYLTTSTFLPLFAVLTHHVLPVLIVLFANVILILRVCYQKSQMNHANKYMAKKYSNEYSTSFYCIYISNCMDPSMCFLYYARIRKK